MNNSFRKKDMICGMSPSFTADFFEGSMKPKVKGGSIPAAGVSGQQLQCNQHNGGMFSTTLTELNVHGGWLGGREGDSGRERLREQEKEGGRERRKEGEKEGGRKGGKEAERGREDNLGLGWLLLGGSVPVHNPSRSFGKKYGNGMANRTLKLG